MTASNGHAARAGAHGSVGRGRCRSRRAGPGRRAGRGTGTRCWRTRRRPGRRDGAEHVRTGAGQPPLDAPRRHGDDLGANGSPSGSASTPAERGDEVVGPLGAVDGQHVRAGAAARRVPRASTRNGLGRLPSAAVAPLDRLLGGCAAGAEVGSSERRRPVLGGHAVDEHPLTGVDEVGDRPRRVLQDVDQVRVVGGVAVDQPDRERGRPASARRPCPSGTARRRPSAPSATAVPSPATLPNEAPSSSTWLGCTSQSSTYRRRGGPRRASPSESVLPPRTARRAMRIELGAGHRRLGVRPPAVEDAPPGERDGRRPPPGPEQRAGDRTDGVGVAAGCERRARNVSARWSHGVAGRGTRVDVMRAERRPGTRRRPSRWCGTTRPGGADGRVDARLPLVPAVGGTRSRPILDGARANRTASSGAAVAIARSMASDHSTQASTLSACGCVSAATSRASSAIAPRSPRWPRATGPVRIRAPLPAASGCAAW